MRPILPRLRPRPPRVALLLVAALTSPALSTDDWPQWLGPARDGTSPETGLLAAWPAEGPPVVWRRPLGQGFSAVTVRGDRLYTLESEGVTRDGLIEDASHEYVVSLAASDGATLWRTRIDASFADQRGSGPRSSPTLDGDRLYVLSSPGKLTALALADGRLLWQRDLVGEHGGELPIWGYAASPWVEGTRVMVAGGGEGRAILAFDRDDGALLWSRGSSPPSYSSPVAGALAGVRQVVFLQGDRVLAVTPDGEELWSHPWEVVNRINIATPLLLDGDRVFVSTSYDVGAVMLRVVAEGDRLAVREVWRNREMKNHFHGSVLAGGRLYGFDNATFKCLDPQTGATCWAHRGLGKGSLIHADGRLVVLSERGRLALVAVDPDAYREVSGFQLVQARTWTAPTLAHGRLYVRTEEELFQLDLRAPVAGGAR
ncbi:MAG TPA: PQQ-binding-like beta-propeller repeat protein [Thermoanaerobaculia bacterium]|nr:PQQ-binding-like beta-propeller repeat protein [Thermoanaerobaculia bacterium]